MKINITCLNHIFTLLCGLILCSSCSQQDSEVLAPDVVARIGERNITLMDIQAEAERRKDGGLQALSPDKLLDRMLLREALLIQAHSEKLMDEMEIRREIERLLVSKVRDRHLVPLIESITVSELELKEAYARRIDEFTQPALVRYAMLYLQKTKVNSESRVEEMRSRLNMAEREAQQLISTDDFLPHHGFAHLSRLYSDDVAGRYRGGDIGWMKQTEVSSRLPAEHIAQLTALEIGAISPILETPTGFYLIMRTDERPERVEPYEKVASALKRALLKEKRTEAEERFYAECVLAAAPDINPVAMKKLNEQTGPDPVIRPDKPLLANGMQ